MLATYLTVIINRAKNKVNYSGESHRATLAAVMTLFILTRTSLESGLHALTAAAQADEKGKIISHK